MTKQYPHQEKLSSTYSNLEKQLDSARNTPISELFKSEPDRLTEMTAEAAGLHLDFSRNLLTREGWQELLSLTEKLDIRASIESMFTGDVINVTEKRAAS